MSKNIDYKSKYWLYDQYWNRECSLTTIAKECGVAHGTIASWMRKFNIARKEGFVKGHQINVGKKQTKKHNEKVSVALREYHKKNLGINKDAEHPNWKGGCVSYHQKQARRVWKEYWREEVPKGYVVHHVDKNRANNDICNLALLTTSYHLKLHRNKRGFMVYLSGEMNN